MLVLQWRNDKGGMTPCLQTKQWLLFLFFFGIRSSASSHCLCPLAMDVRARRRRNGVW
jgi:hypothetical protein